MKEAIIKLTSDHIKVKGGEYVQDLVRCRECKHYHEMWGCTKNPNEYLVVELDDFCSYGEAKEK